MKVTLKRLDYTDGGTLGKIMAGGYFVCYCVERPWRDNKRNISCIPPGTYPLEWQNSPKFGYRLHIEEVPGRSHILIHPGNRITDSEGCILPATMSGCRDGMIVGYQSRAALEKLETICGGKRNMTIEIVEPGRSIEYNPEGDNDA